MRKPDYKKMKLMLAANTNKQDRGYILNKMSVYDVLYEFVKVFGTSRIPKKDIE